MKTNRTTTNKVDWGIPWIARQAGLQHNRILLKYDCGWLSKRQEFALPTVNSSNNISDFQGIPLTPSGDQVLLQVVTRYSEEYTGYFLSLDNDQLDAHLLYFTIRLLWSSTCFKHYMLIIRRLMVLMQHLVSSSQSVAVRCTGWERTQFSLNLCTGCFLSQPVQRTATDWEDDTRCCINTISLLMMSI